jgi:putative ABC transport system permease protein
MKLFAMAARGLARNRRRSLTTMLAIALGFAAIALFAGYTLNVYRGLSLQAVHGEMLGHLTLSRQGMSREGKLNPERYLLSGNDIATISELVRDEPGVRLVTPRLALSGIIANGRASTIFVAEGLDPEAIRTLQGNLNTGLADALSGNEQAPSSTAYGPLHDSAALATGLADLLQFKKGDQAALLTNTLYGQANAVDITVAKIFDTGNAATNDLYSFLPLDLVRYLYDAEQAADRLTVLLDDVSKTELVRASLQQRLTAAGFAMEIKTWNELSAFYTQVRGMFDMIFGFIFSIVLTVALMSVANSMAMTVTERTREIGTLRSIGLRRGGVVRLFMVEALLLCLVGCLTGLLLTIAVRAGINAADISYVPPNSTSPVPLLVDFDISRAAVTALLMLAVGALAAWLPARRAARQPIIEALGHV